MYFILGTFAATLSVQPFHLLLVESLYLEPLYLEFSLCRTKYLVPRMRFQANFISLSRTLSISNKYFGPLKVRDREILLYAFHKILSNILS